LQRLPNEMGCAESEEPEAPITRILGGYGVPWAEEKLSAEEREGEPFNVTLIRDGAATREVQIWPHEYACRLKARLYDEYFYTSDHLSPPDGMAPPSAAALTMGGEEIPDDVTFSDVDVQTGATLVLSFEAPLHIRLRLPGARYDFGPMEIADCWPQRVCLWGKEPVKAALQRWTRNLSFAREETTI